MYSNLIKRISDKRFVCMHDLNDDNVDLIAYNVNMINRYNGNADLNVSTVDYNENFEYLLKKGWQEDMGLYDSLIHEYNLKNPSQLLKKWFSAAK